MIKYIFLSKNVHLIWILKKIELHFNDDSLEKQIQADVLWMEDILKTNV
jgi:hypothetical protein